MVPIGPASARRALPTIGVSPPPFAGFGSRLSAGERSNIVCELTILPATGRAKTSALSPEEIKDQNPALTGLAAILTAKTAKTKKKDHFLWDFLFFCITSSVGVSKISLFYRVSFSEWLCLSV